MSIGFLSFQEKHKKILILIIKYLNLFLVIQKISTEYRKNLYDFKTI